MAQLRLLAMRLDKDGCPVVELKENGQPLVIDRTEKRLDGHLASSCRR